MNWFWTRKIKDHGHGGTTMDIMFYQFMLISFYHFMVSIHIRRSGKDNSIVNDPGSLGFIFLQKVPEFNPMPTYARLIH